ncbi:hypothetical protein QSJ18_13475 [Gordonia sp. ABSL1-1]|uniref:hypothetical protein n=1 Tax=Gordonia sp. ABSL1-1 TaxID=3053923 RepID=UPI0025748C87|nr:hypothetical protein [Gordonia sp. ABSL1-1]MDL9937758.1 hypothetical protein [Gordonia sp. ABSL1-1]
MTSSQGTVSSLAAQLPGFDPSPAINAVENQLANYLNTPTADILGQLGLPVPPGMPASGPIPGLPEIPGLPNGGNLFESLNADIMVQPLLDALGTLGTGLSEAFDPTEMLSTITSAISSIGQSLTSVISAMKSGWSGNSAEAAGKQATSLGKDGVNVAQQSTKIKSTVAEAGVDTTTTEAELMEILTTFQAAAAAGAGLMVTGAGPAVLIAAATEAISRTMVVMGLHKGKMAVNTAKVAADGTPVDITNASQVPTEFLTAAVQVGTGLAQTGVGFAGTAFKTGQKTVKAVTDAGAKFNESMQKAQKEAAGDGKPPTPGGGGAASPSGSRTGGGGGGGKIGGGGGGGGGGISAAAAMPLAARAEISGAPANPASGAGRSGASVATAGVAGGPMGGGPMGGAPMGGAGAGAGKGEGSGHTAASFLHTAQGGDDIVGEFADVAPAVIGETDNQQVISPDIDLRI